MVSSSEKVTSQVWDALDVGVFGIMVCVLSLGLDRVVVETSIGPATVSGALCGLQVCLHTPFSISSSSGRPP